MPPTPPADPFPAEPEVPDTARITLRRPTARPTTSTRSAMSIEPGQRDRVMALVRNQGSIVDNYQLRVEGMPDDWWSIYPDTVYLVPFGTGGTYEQEVEIHLHPPRSPEAEAKLWELEVVAHSKAQERTAAAAPMGLVIEPYTETATSIRPQRGKGRRKAHYDVAVENKANAPGAGRARGRGPRRRARLRLQPAAARGPARQDDRVRDAGPPAEADLDRPRDREALHGQHADRREGRGAARRRADVRRRARERARGRAEEEGPVPPPARPPTASPASTARASTSRRSTSRA